MGGDPETALDLPESHPIISLAFFDGISARWQCFDAQAQELDQFRWQRARLFQLQFVGHQVSAQNVDTQQFAKKNDGELPPSVQACTNTCGRLTIVVPWELPIRMVCGNLAHPRASAVGTRRPEDDFTTHVVTLADRAKRLVHFEDASGACP